MESEFKGNIMNMRAVEDSIRASHKYAKGLLSRTIPYPSNGENFPSKLVTEYYEVYPDMKITLDMSIIDAILFLGGALNMIQVHFRYNYNNDEAKIYVKGGTISVKELARAIPGFSDALARAIANGNGSKS